MAPPRSEARSRGAAARTLRRPGFTVDHDDVKAFSDKVFKWWQNHHSEFPTTAASERVFSLLKQLFGKQQLSSLMDYIQGSIMLNYNDRAL